MPRITQRHMMIVRVTPDPSWTSVCTGTTEAAGITTAMSASRISPPAVPVKSPMNAVKNDAQASPTNRARLMSAGNR